jgi:hypothetical protein
MNKLYKITEIMAICYERLKSGGQVLFLLEKWWREAGFGLAEVCLAKSAFS